MGERNIGLEVMGRSGGKIYGNNFKQKITLWIQ